MFGIVNCIVSIMLKFILELTQRGMILIYTIPSMLYIIFLADTD